MEYNTDKKERQQIQYIFYRPLCIDAKTSLKKNEACAIIEKKEMESAPARAQSRILPYPDTHNAACGIETFFKLSNFCSIIVPTHTMLRAALKLGNLPASRLNDEGPDTHNAACGIDSKTALRVHIGHTEPFSYAKSAQQS